MHRRSLLALPALLCAPALLRAAPPAPASPPVADPLLPEPTAASPAAPNPPDTGFPRQVRHALGTSTLAAPPTRVVSLGLNDQDFLYALGIAPVGVHEWYGDYPYATWPWAEPARAALNARPAVQRGFEVDVEWVVMQQPDLITASFYDLDPETWATLSRVAPVITRPVGSRPWRFPWEAQLRLIAEATGREAQAEAVIAGLEARIAGAACSRCRGASGTMAYFAEGRVVIYPGSDGGNRLLGQLGISTPAGFDALIGDASQRGLSPERLDLLDLDTVVWLVPEAARAEIEAMAVYRRLRLSRENRAIWADRQLAGALSFQSPLSIGAALDQLVPALERALGGA